MIAKVERMSDSPDHRPELRISDTDRDRAAEVLREAHAQGRITVDELDERLTSVYAAKTFADLVPVTRDLPATQDAARPRPRRAAGSAARPGSGCRWRSWAGRAATAVGRAAGVQGRRDAGRDQAGHERRHLRRGRDLIKAYAVMGGMEITVPQDADVEVGAFGLMGGVDHGGEGPACPGGAPDPHRRRRGDGRHRGQARPGPATAKRECRDCHRPADCPCRAGE